MNEELKQYFRPEFLNRLDEIIVFRQLTRDEVKVIAEIMLKEVFGRMQEKGIIGKIPGFSVSSHVAMAMKFSKQDKRFTNADRKRIRGKVEERARQHRLNTREQFILAAWRRARAIAKAIGIRGIRGRFIMARSIPAMGRLIKAEIRQFKRG